MAINTAGLSGNNRVGVGAGTYNGQSAAAIGFQHMFSDHRASVSIGAAFGDGDTSGGVGAGFSW
jgi:autotransporter adhesin